MAQVGVKRCWGREHRVLLDGRAVETLDAREHVPRPASRSCSRTGAGRADTRDDAVQDLQHHRIATAGARASGPRSGIGRPRRRTIPREVVEAALAHVVQNKVEAAYARSDLFERRRLMNDWEAYLAGAHRPQQRIAEPAEQEVAASAGP